MCGDRVIARTDWDHVPSCLYIPLVPVLPRHHIHLTERERERERERESGKPRVGIIGGGISGLAAAKELRRLEPTLFEATDSIGGVWKHCSFRSTRLQTPRPDYEFSDYQWRDRTDPSFPTHAEIMEYLHGYATRFDLWRLIRLESKVVEVRFSATAATPGSRSPGETSGRPWASDRCGRSAWCPACPALSSTATCRTCRSSLRERAGGLPGKVMHSLDYCKLDEEAAETLMKGKKVVVIGYKKSAIDLAVECAAVNREYR
ncbi:Flavin-containing monooxygenase [Musa troglodytarum]|uniref:Flavin-containing monooxygenase n=1 Tax=Musa troglodytarum TaxID=320322 RepID=A0A9E7G7T0_9LILI|nr:Flavin-containing monooxygenase [Musa troglodytarum]